VLHAIQVIKYGGQHALFELIQEVEQDAFARGKNIFAQGDELLIGDTTVFESGRILGPPQGQERARCFPGLFNKRLGRGVLPECVQGVDLQRQEIQPHWVRGGHDGARQCMHVHQHAGLEFDFEDRAPFARLERIRDPA
jgi:hypothetical protein